MRGSRLAPFFMQFNFLSSNQKEIISLSENTLEYYQAHFNQEESLAYFKKLSELPWGQDKIKLYGKTHNIPRLQCFIADENLSYEYSGIKLIRSNWTKELLAIKHEVESISGEEFNCVLCNLYRDGRDYAAWHSDDEDSLGVDPVIASVSFGAERSIHFKHKTNKGLAVVKLTLANGSLLIMNRGIQKFWKHQLAKTSRPVSSRINLTFRKVI